MDVTRTWSRPGKSHGLAGKQLVPRSAGIQTAIHRGCVSVFAINARSFADKKPRFLSLLSPIFYLLSLFLPAFGARALPIND